jgi:diguanylate cyclase (GGDEF)-like protein
MKPIPQLDFSTGVDLAASIGVLAHRLLDDLTDDDIPDARHRALVERALAVAAAAEERIAAQSRRIAFLEGLSRTDELTGLLNRRGFLNELRRAIARARRHGETGIVIYGDIDRFKEINDRYGHACGDAVLREVGRVLAGAVREVDVVARLGGDEFAILLAQTSWRDGCKRSRALQGALDRIACDFDGHKVTACMSLGIEPYGAQDEAEALLVRADTDMYCNKRRRAGLALCSAAE